MGNRLLVMATGTFGKLIMMAAIAGSLLSFCLVASADVGADSSASPSEQTALARGEFDCDNVFSDKWYPCTDPTTVRVPAGHEHRVAVRGSDGKGVNFQARNAAGQVLGTTRNCIEVGDGSVLVWKNNTGSPVNAHMRLALCDAGGADVHATQYY